LFYDSLCHISSLIMIRNHGAAALSILASVCSHGFGPASVYAKDMIEIHAVTEIGEDAVPPLIIEIDFAGINGTEAHKESKYFSFSAEFERGVLDASGKRGMPALNLVLVPITRELVHIKIGEDGESKFSREILKTQFRREANLGLQGSVSIYPIGWVWDGESKISESKSLARLSKFYNLAVDLIGMGFLSTTHGGTLPNVQMGNIEFQGGVGLDLTDQLELRLSVGAEAHGGVGSYASGNSRAQAGFGSLSSVYAELDAGLQTMRGHYAAFVISEYQRFDAFGRFDNPGLDEILVRVGIKGSW
jgi:hypothetical protein